MRQLDFSELRPRAAPDRTVQEQPSAPKITAREKREHGHEASFALRLEGVSLDQGVNNKPTLTPTLAGMLPGQSLMLSYSMVSDSGGALGFRMGLRGIASGSSKREAVERAKELWGNLELTVEACASGYQFQSLPHDAAEEVEGPWQTHIEPKAVAITRVSTSCGLIKQLKTVLMRVADEEPGVAGSLFTALMKYNRPIRVEFRMTALELTDEEQSMVKSATKTARSGASSRCGREGLEKTNLIDCGSRDELGREMEKWLRHPQGYRLECWIDSEEKPSRSFLAVLASEVFAGMPVTIRTRRLDGKFHAPAAKTPIVNMLKLSNCFRGAHMLPTTLPDKALLIGAGIPRRHVMAAKGLPRHKSGLLLGHIDDGSARHEVRLHDDDRSRHCYILGATGTGKSTLLGNMILQDIEAGKGGCLIDPHGDLYGQMLNAIPGDREKDVVLIDPCDFEHPVGINFLDCPEENRSLHKSLIANEMIKIFSSLYDMKVCGGPMFETYMRNAIMLAMDHPEGGTLLDIPLIFESKEYRQFLLKKCEDPYVKGFWLHQAEEVSGEASLANIAPIGWSGR